MQKPIIFSEKEYDFSDYPQINASTGEILEYFGYQKHTNRLELPRSRRQLPSLERLYGIIEDTLLHISLESEIPRREFLIAPMMSELRHLTGAKLRSEYWFEYNHQLKGSFDYLLRHKKNLLVVKAKNADMSRGFTQLAVEMVALDKADETEQKTIYGAVTTGNIWQFGKLDRERKIVVQDITSYDLLPDLEDLIRIFVGILEI